MAITCKVGMAQVAVEGGALEANLSRACDMVAAASSEGCDIVLLPECLDTGWTHPSATVLACPIPGASSDRLSDAALRAGIHVVAGITERDAGAVYNTAVLYSPAGEILLKHRKINILSIAQDLYAVGDRLCVAQTPLGRIGLNICADNFPNSLAQGHTLARMGARMILSPCAWAVDADHDNDREPYGAMWLQAYSELARLYDLTVVGVSNVGWISGGPWEGRKCVGCSLAVGPSGQILAQGDYGESAEGLTTFCTEITPANAAGTDIAGALKSRGYTGP